MILLTINETIDATTIENLIATLTDKAISLGGKIIVAAITYFVGRWLISILLKIFNRILRQRDVEESVQSFLNSSMSILLKVLLLIAIIGVLGIETTSFAAIMAALAFAVGMAMKDNLSNFAGGILILVTKPFRINDRIIIQGLEGVVNSIGFVHTVIKTGDGKTIYIPNGSLMSSNIINITNTGNLKTTLTFKIPYGHHSGEIKSMIQGVVDNNSKILRNPEPFIGITNVMDGHFEISVGVWTLNTNQGSISAELNEAIYELLEDKKIYTPSVMRVKMEDKIS